MYGGNPTLPMPQETSCPQRKQKGTLGIFLNQEGKMDGAIPKKILRENLLPFAKTLKHARKIMIPGTSPKQQWSGSRTNE